MKGTIAATGVSEASADASRVAAERAAQLQAAKAAGLRYVSHHTPGIRRMGTLRAFRYLDESGDVIRDEAVLQRIARLAIPPAWTDVWICSNPQGHLQAVGRDVRGRRQYRYHARWRETRDETKFHRMAAFGAALPKIRRQVARHLKEGQLSRSKVLATVVRLLETTFIRIGNRQYLRENGSFGLTTLRDRHVDIRGARVHFYFKGKSKVRHKISIEDRHLAGIVRRLRDLPGYELFQYVDENGERHAVHAEDVNAYLREITSEDFTAKDFRTWAGTILASEALALCEFTSNRQAQKRLREAVANVAERLGNTAAVCRKCYIHPAVIDAFLEGALEKKIVPARASAHLTAQEAAVLRFLRAKARQKPVPLEKMLARSIRAARKAV